jgi:4-oxalocrotonate tautomerase
MLLLLAICCKDVATPVPAACREAAKGSFDDVIGNNAKQRERDEHMPFVNVKLIKGVFTPDQKREMITKLTDTMVGIEGESMRQVTWVAIEEVDSGDWGIGGHGLTTQDVKDLQAGRVHA